jgi:signal transduction histidine kinase
LRTRTRRERLLRAEHEIRSALCGLRLALDAERSVSAKCIDGQFERIAAGLAELKPGRQPQRPQAVLDIVRGAVAAWAPAARALGRRIDFQWHVHDAGVMAAAPQLSQVAGNLIANSLEHGTGVVRVRGTRADRRVVVSVADDGPRNPGPIKPGRGLTIAAAAVRASGGDLTLARDAQGTAATVELPLAGQ